MKFQWREIHPNFKASCNFALLLMEPLGIYKVLFQVLHHAVSLEAVT